MIRVSRLRASSSSSSSSSSSAPFHLCRLCRMVRCRRSRGPKQRGSRRDIEVDRPENPRAPSHPCTRARTKPRDENLTIWSGWDREKKGGQEKEREMEEEMLAPSHHCIEAKAKPRDGNMNTQRSRNEIDRSKAGKDRITRRMKERRKLISEKVNALLSFPSRSAESFLIGQVSSLSPFCSVWHTRNHVELTEVRTRANKERRRSGQLPGSSASFCLAF